MDDEPLDQFDAAWDALAAGLAKQLEFLNSRRNDPTRHFNMLSGTVAAVMRLGENGGKFLDATDDEKAQGFIEKLRRDG